MPVCPAASAAEGTPGNKEGAGEVVIERLAFGIVTIFALYSLFVNNHF